MRLKKFYVFWDHMNYNFTTFYLILFPLSYPGKCNPYLKNHICGKKPFGTKNICFVPNMCCSYFAVFKND